MNNCVLQYSSQGSQTQDTWVGKTESQNHKSWNANTRYIYIYTHTRIHIDIYTYLHITCDALTHS